MSLKNILLVVRNIEQSKHFYHELFGLQILRDFGISIRVLAFRLSLISIERMELNITDLNWIY